MYGLSGRLMVGANFNGFSVTLDIGALGGNSNALTPSGPGANPATRELTTLRLMSLSMSPDITYRALSSVFAPDSASVVHYEISTKGESDGKPYTWDVYQDSQRDQTRATLYEGRGTSGTELYTDYMDGTQFTTRCYSDSTCVTLSSPPATDPFQLGNKAQNFLLDGINAYILDGELWNLGTVSAPDELGIGKEQVYKLAFVGGPYPITVYVSEQTVVVGVISNYWLACSRRAGSRLPALGAGAGEV